MMNHLTIGFLALHIVIFECADCSKYTDVKNTLTWCSGRAFQYYSQLYLAVVKSDLLAFCRCCRSWVLGIWYYDIKGTTMMTNPQKLIIL